MRGELCDIINGAAPAGAAAKGGAAAEDDVVMGASGGRDAATNKFDAVIGALEDIMCDESFVGAQVRGRARVRVGPPLLHTPAWACLRARVLAPDQGALADASARATCTPARLRRCAAGCAALLLLGALRAVRGHRREQARIHARLRGVLRDHGGPDRGQAR